MEIDDFLKKSLSDKIITLLVLAVVFLLGWTVRNFPFLIVLNTLAENISLLNMLIIIIILFLSLLLVIVFSLKQSRTIKSLKAKPDEGVMRAHFGVNWKVYLSTGAVSDVPYCGCCNPPKILQATQLSDKTLIFSCNGRGYSFVRSQQQEDTYESLYKKVQQIYKKPK